ncbi:hypothetical protein [Amycolatopsis taiwanensis]|uniref:hypothetical protein n=1 Tax=Amycolatopsis taiwanensis TaxID=342230 RepID=UPI000488B693|nr:hypothetical protein [Amycolatopsis taiwanensis]
MALNIGELVAYLKMDKSEWDRSKTSAKRDLDDIADEADKAGKKTDKSTKDAAKKVERNFSAIQFAALFAGLPAAAAVAAVAAAGSLALVSGGFIALTAVAVSSNLQVRDSFSQLSEHVGDSVKQMAAPLAGEFVDAAHRLGEEFDHLQPQISAAMRNSAQDVSILTDGVLGLAREAMPGLVVATNRDTDALRGLAQFMAYTGRGATDFFVNLSTGSTGAQRDMVEFGRITQQLLGFLGQLLANLANNGTSALSGFGAGLSTVEQILLQLTSSGSAAYSVIGGFITGIDGGLSVLQGLISLLGLLPDGVASFGGELLATTKLLKAFGVDAGAAFDGLGERVKNAKGLGNQLKTGFLGLLQGAMNPLTLGVGALTLGLGLLGKAQQDDAARTAAHADRVRDLASALRESGGAIDENVRKTAASTLQDFDAGDGKRNLLADVRNLAGPQGMQLLTQAYLGNKQAGDQLRAMLEANIQAHTDVSGAATYYGEIQTNNVGVVDEVGKKNQQLLDILDAEGGTFQQAIQNNLDWAEASGEAGTATGNLTYAQKLAQQASSDLAKDMKGLGDAENDAATKGKLLQQVLDILNGRAPSHEDAIASINEQIRQLGEQFGKGANRADGWGAALLNADGTVNTATANGGKLYQAMTSLEQGFANAGASIDDLVKSGKSYEDASKQVSAELTTQRQRFIDVATQMGLTRQQAEQLANKYGLIPAEVLTYVTQPGMPNAQQAADILRGKILAVPDSHTTITSALTAEAIAKLTELGYRVTTLPNGTVRVESDTGPAQGNITKLINDNNGKVIKLIVRADGSVRVGNNIANANGNLLMPFAAGGIAAYAAGGLTPMSGAVATVVPPGTQRVIGDNPQYDELFAPLNGSRRTANLITAAAKHEGLPVGETVPVPVQAQRASVHVEHFHPPANASPWEIADELDWLSRTGG